MGSSGSQIEQDLSLAKVNILIAFSVYVRRFVCLSVCMSARLSVLEKGKNRYMGGDKTMDSLLP